MSDELSQDIREWIQQANDPVIKGTLVVLYQLNQNASATTKCLKTMSNDFRAHKEKTEKIIQRATGAWWLIGAVVLLGEVYRVWITLSPH